MSSTRLKRKGDQPTPGNSNDYGVSVDQLRFGKVFWHESGGTGVLMHVDGDAYTSFMLGDDIVTPGSLEGGGLGFIEAITPFDIFYAAKVVASRCPDRVRHRWAKLRRRASLPHGYRLDVACEAGTAWPVTFYCNCLNYGGNPKDVEPTKPRWRGVRAAAREALSECEAATSFEQDWQREETRRMEAEQRAGQFLTEKNQAEAEVRRLEHRIDALTGEYGLSDKPDAAEPSAEQLPASVPDHAMLFKIVDGEPVAHYRRDDDRPDGAALLTISQMVDRCGHDEAHWVDQWRAAITVAEPATPSSEPATDGQAGGDVEPLKVSELRIGQIVSDESRDAVFVVTKIDGDAFIGLSIGGAGPTAGYKYGCDFTDITHVCPLSIFEVADGLRASPTRT